MITFSMNTNTSADSYSTLVLEVIRDNTRYFKKFNGQNWEEAAQRSYLMAINNRKEMYGSDIIPYIKKLARTIMIPRSSSIMDDIENESGELNNECESLKVFMDTSKIEDYEEVKDLFKVLYLYEPSEFMKLQNIFLLDDKPDMNGLKDAKIKDKKLKTGFMKVCDYYGKDTTLHVLQDFFKELPKLTRSRVTNETKLVPIEKSDFTLLSSIPDAPTIVDEKGKYYGVDKSLLTMNVNPDHIKWKVIGTQVDVLKVDISDFMNFMYEDVFVDEGLNTKHITYCGNKFSLTTPGGVKYVGVDKDKYMNIVRVELILNVIKASVGTLVAVSPDSIFVKKPRTFKYDKLRLKAKTGFIIDSKITVWNKRYSN